MKKPPLETHRARQRARRRLPRSAATRACASAARPSKTPAYARDALRAGNRIAGPALIEEHASTTVLLPGDRMRVDGSAT